MFPWKWYRWLWATMSVREQNLVFSAKATRALNCLRHPSRPKEIHSSEVHLVTVSPWIMPLVRCLKPIWAVFSPVLLSWASTMLWSTIHLNLFVKCKSICRILSLKLYMNVLLLKHNLLKRSSLSTDLSSLSYISWCCL